MQYKEIRASFRTIARIVITLDGTIVTVELQSATVQLPPVKLRQLFPTFPNFFDL